MGLVTLEDILEEIVGDITDEFDFESDGFTRQQDGSILVSGTATIRDLNRQFDWELPDEEATTIAGLVINEAETIPVEGEVFTFFGFSFEITGRKKNQITRIVMRPAQ
jgi:Mg2+/Co2+ transporter CorB